MRWGGFESGRVEKKRKGKDIGWKGVRVGAGAEEKDPGGGWGEKASIYIPGNQSPHLYPTPA